MLLRLYMVHSANKPIAFWTNYRRLCNTGVKPLDVPPLELKLDAKVVLLKQVGLGYGICFTTMWYSLPLCPDLACSVVNGCFCVLKHCIGCVIMIVKHVVAVEKTPEPSVCRLFPNPKTESDRF
jgi:hypothetical protein